MLEDRLMMADLLQREPAAERGAAPQANEGSVPPGDAAGAAAGGKDHSGRPEVGGDGANVNRTSREADPLAEAFISLFTKFAEVVQGELQCSNSEYELLTGMNLRTAAEYDNFSDFASGLRVFVERLKDKNETLSQYLKEIEGIDRSVTELEVLVSTLDNYTNTLYMQMMAAFADN